MTTHVAGIAPPSDFPSINLRSFDWLIEKAFGFCRKDSSDDLFHSESEAEKYASDVSSAILQQPFDTLSDFLPLLLLSLFPSDRISEYECRFYAMTREQIERVRKVLFDGEYQLFLSLHPSVSVSLVPSSAAQTLSQSVIIPIQKILHTAILHRIRVHSSSSPAIVSTQSPKLDDHSQSITQKQQKEEEKPDSTFTVTSKPIVRFIDSSKKKQKKKLNQKQIQQRQQQQQQQQRHQSSQPSDHAAHIDTVTLPMLLESQEDVLSLPSVDDVPISPSDCHTPTPTPTPTSHSSETNVQSIGNSQKKRSKKKKSASDDLRKATGGDNRGEESDDDDEQEENEDTKMQVDPTVRDWLREQVNVEVDRIKMAGSRALAVKVNNMVTVKRGKRLINRIEVETAMDFDKVQQIMISEPVWCPVKPRFKFIVVLAFTDMNRPLPMIMPYLFMPNPQNDLTNWLFINADEKESLHKIKSFGVVGGGAE